MAAHQREKYDVFLCHRGPDTKKHFSVWLKRELERKKLQVFFDDRSLGTGDRASETMDSAMQTATCGLVVLSRSFFVSKWCMQELRHFLDRGNCIPVCYDVTPDDINAEKIRNKEGEIWKVYGGQLWTSCSMTEADWTQTIQDLADVCMNNIEKYDDYQDTYVDAIVRDICKRLNRPCLLGKRVNMTPYSDNMHFVGRGKDLADLGHKLSKCGRICIQGMGGAGKTQLALKYVHSRQHQYDKLLWIDASKEALHNSFLELAKPLGIDLGVNETRSWLPSILRPNQDKDRDIVLEIRIALEQSETPCLLVLDNLDDEEQYVRYLPREGPCHVILTARQRMGGNQHVLELKNLEEESACELLKSRMALETPDEKVKELAEALGRHALSLAISSRLMYKGGHGPEWLLTKLRTKEAVQVFDGVPDDPYFQKSSCLTTLFHTSLTTMLTNNCEADVAEVADLARMLLRLGGRFATAPIRLELLKRAAMILSGMDDSNDDIETASGLLVEYALAERTRDGGTAFHPLVQSFGRWEGKKEQDQVVRAVMLAINQVGELGQDTEHIAYGVSMALPEVDDPSGVRLPLDNNDLLHVNDGALALADFYVNLYQTVKASSMLDRCERVLQRVGPEDTSRWFRLWHLRFKCFDCEGKYVEAEALYKWALASSVARLGQDHYQTVMIASNLANVLYRVDKFVEAVALNRWALAIHEAMLGPDHPDTVLLINNQALLLEQQGNYHEAKALYKRGLASSEARLGRDHLQIALISSNLAAMLHEQGEYGQAEALSRQALRIRETKLGPDHPVTADSLNSLGEVLREQGEYCKAEALHNRALAIRKAKLGPDHPYTATSFNNLALVLRSQGKYGEAEALFRRALAIFEARFGPDHPATAGSLSNLALVMQEQGKFGEAEALHRRALASSEAKLGPNRFNAAVLLNNLALVLQDQGKLDEAEALHRQALATREARLGPDHPDTGQSLNNLATVMEKKCKYGEAEALLRRALAIFKATMGPDHPNTVTASNSLAVVLQDQGKLDEAEALHRQALATREARLGPDHPDTGQSLNNLATVMEKKCKYGEAEALLRRALAIFKATMGPDHPNTVTASNSLAVVLQDQGKLDEAEALHRQALATREARLGPDHPDTGQSLNNLATVMAKKCKYGEAEALLRRALAVSKATMGPDHPNTVTASNSLAVVLRQRR
eukprot:jgi/Chlat1/6711/Chrsp5S06988